MSRIKLLKSTHHYSHYLEGFYRDRPGLKDEPFAVQRNLLLHDSHYWSDFWKQNLEATDEFEVEELVFNAVHMQKAWAKEHGVAYSEERWVYDILQAQIQHYAPDVWFSHDSQHLEPTFRKTVRKNTPSIKMVIGNDGIALNDPDLFQGCDVIISVADFILKFYEEKGIRTKLLPAGFDPIILDRIQPASQRFEATFVGSLFTFKGGHLERLKLLANIARQVPVDYFLSAIDIPWQKHLREQIGRLRRGKFQQYMDAQLIRKINRGQLFGLDMWQVLADSKISLNHHIDVARNEAANMRLYEATGVGSLLLTDWKPNLPTIFEPDAEVVTFKNSEEAVEKIKYLLDHEDEREKIARAGQQRTLKDHNFRTRILDFADWLKNNL
jgi:glycosyltransferase involved in cell wall biosynthesis